MFRWIQARQAAEGPGSVRLPVAAPNPHRLTHLRDKTGLDEAVQDYVRSSRDFMALVDHAVGHSCHGDGIILAFGCVGGRHRSVAAAEETADRLRKMGYEVEVIHGELGYARSG